MPFDYPPTAQASEFFAALYAAQVCQQPCTLYGDCLGVVNQYSLDPDTWGDEKKAYSGIMKQARIDDACNKWDKFVKVKAHVTLSQDMSPLEIFHAKGNDWADKQALMAEELHQKPDPQQKSDFERMTKVVKCVLKVIANVLPLWPMYTERHVRDTSVKGSAAPVKQTRMRHQWFLGHDRWHCFGCRARTANQRLTNKRRQQSCHGLADRLSMNGEEGIGHRLVEFSSEVGDFTICASCGFWGVRRSVRLAQPCRERLTTRRSVQAWRRVFTKGLHPYSGMPMRQSSGGARNSLTSVSKSKLKGVIQRAMRRQRMMGKTTPWELQTWMRGGPLLNATQMTPSMPLMPLKPATKTRTPLGS